MLSAMKTALRKIWLQLPGKRAAFRLLRSLVRLSERVWRHLYFSGPFDVHIDSNASFRIFHNGHLVENEIFWSGLFGAWEGQSLKAWCDLASHSHGIIDLGANSGVYALAAEAVNPGARIYAIEPFRPVVEILARNLELNESTVQLHCVAISDHIGQERLFSTSQSTFEYAASLNADFNPDAKAITMVEVTTLDALLDQHPLDSVDLIKIDTEGQEAEVLNGMRRTLERFTPNMLVEVLDEKAERAVLQITNQYGYEYIWIDEAVGRVRERPSDPQSRNMLFLRPER